MPERIKLPAKTKIAVWWIRAVAVSIAAATVLLYSMYGSLRPCACDDGALCLCSLMMVAILPRLSEILFFIYLPIFLLSWGISRGGRGSWFYSMAIMLFLGIPPFIFSLSGFVIYFTSDIASYADGISYGMPLIVLISSLVAFLVPAFLLFEDRKNYFAAIEKAKGAG